MTFIKKFTDGQTVADAIRLLDPDGSPQVAGRLQNPSSPGIGNDKAVVVGQSFI
jgi:hypothetical protein